MQEINDGGRKVLDAKRKDPWGITDLHNAAYEGRLDDCRWLVENGCEIDAKNFFGGMALHIAGYDKICALLVAQMFL